MAPAPPAGCPRCQSPLEDLASVHRCSGCQGSWIPEATLHQRITAARGRHTRLTWKLDERAALTCPVCVAPMDPILVKKIPIDRCAHHGVWFDANELAQLLELAAATAPLRARPAGAMAAAAAVPVIATPPAADEDEKGLGLVGDVAESALEIAAEASVFEALIDVIGSIFD